MSYFVDLFDRYLGSFPGGVVRDTVNPFELIRYLGGVVLIVICVLAVIYVVLLFLRFLLKK